MDEELMQEIILGRDLNKPMNSVRTAEDLGESKRIIEYFEGKGYDVKKYKEIQQNKEEIMLSTNIN
ncbi:MAG: hypothetical protein ABIE36_03490 [Candidatus Diapherotrites archaeon]